MSVMATRKTLLPEHWRMRLRLACLFAWQAALASRKRVMLAVLGVAIGIASVVSMLMIGASVETQSMTLLSALGNDVVTIEPEGGAINRLPFQALDNLPPPAPSMAGTMFRHMTEISIFLNAMPESSDIAPVISPVHCGGLPGEEVALDFLGATHQLQQTMSLKLADGRFFSPSEGDALNIVLGAKAMQELRKIRPDLHIGSLINICGQSGILIGVLENNVGADLIQTFQLNRAILVNLKGVHRLTGDPERFVLLVRPRASVAVSKFVDGMRVRLAAVLPFPLTVSSASAMSEIRSQQANLYSTFLAILGGVALAVGSLGITNIMIVAVTERRGEIGLRKAIGARVADIAAQFVIEAIMICVFGGVIGAIIGTACTGAILSVAGLPLSLGWTTPLIVIGLACLSGLVAGVYPAVRAARMDAVETLM